MCNQGTMQEVIIDGKSISVDSCIAQDVNKLNARFNGMFRSVGCCCGHGKYPPTIVVREINTGEHHEFYTNRKITRRRNLYYKDEEGVFHLPEVNEIQRKPVINDHADEDKL